MALAKLLRRNRRQVFLAVFALSIYSVTFAHKDRPIKVLPSGQLEGLPDRYQPAILAISPNSNVTLRLGQHFLEFPPCISSYFRRAQRESLFGGASWYHDPKSMPYYLHFELTEHQAGAKANGWSVMVNLDTLELMSLKTWSWRGDTEELGLIDLNSICTPAEVEALVPKVVER